MYLGILIFSFEQKNDKRLLKCDDSLKDFFLIIYNERNDLRQSTHIFCCKEQNMNISLLV